MKNTEGKIIAKLEETLKIDIPDIEEDDPDQVAEWRMQRIAEDLLNFIRRVIDKHTVSVEEQDLLEFDIATMLLSRFHTRCSTALLAARLKDRRAG